MRDEADFDRCLVKAQNLVDGLRAQIARLKEDRDGLEADNRLLKLKVAGLENRTASERDIEAMGYLKLPVGADGKPIGPGQTVYQADGGPAMDVLQLVADASCEWEVNTDMEDGNPFQPAQLTHEPPKRFPLDANLVECKPGDLLWPARDFEITFQRLPLEVIETDECGLVFVSDRDEMKSGDEAPWGFRSSLFTHAEPDNWERLERDAGMDAYAYARDRMGLDCAAEPARESRSIDMRRDLVRRAKALAGVEGGDEG